MAQLHMPGKMRHLADCRLSNGLPRKGFGQADFQRARASAAIVARQRADKTERKRKPSVIEKSYEMATKPAKELAAAVADQRADKPSLRGDLP
jgi:hypothetical protein